MFLIKIGYNLIDLEENTKRIFKGQVKSDLDAVLVDTIERFPQNQPAPPSLLQATDFTQSPLYWRMEELRETEAYYPHNTIILRAIPSQCRCVHVCVCVWECVRGRRMERDEEAEEKVVPVQGRAGQGRT